MKTNILFRPIRMFTKRIILLSVTGAATVFISNMLLSMNGTSYLAWIRDAVLVGLIAAVSFGLVSIIAFRDDLKKLLKKK